MTCVKTGAVVHFPQYGTTMSADVFRVGNSLVVKTHPGQVYLKNDYHNEEACELEINSPPSGEEFWRPEIGVFVVKDEYPSVVYYVDAPWITGHANGHQQADQNPS